MHRVHLRSAKQAVSIARKLTDAAVMQMSHPAGNGVSGWKHAVLHFLHLRMEATLAEALEWVEETEGDEPRSSESAAGSLTPSELLKSLDRAPMCIRRRVTISTVVKRDKSSK